MRSRLSVPATGTARSFLRRDCKPFCDQGLKTGAGKRAIRKLLIIWLLQQAPMGSVYKVARRSPGRFVSFRPTSPQRRLANSICGEADNSRIDGQLLFWWRWKSVVKPPGRVRMNVIPDFKASTIIPVLTRNVAPVPPSIRTASRVSQASLRPALNMSLASSHSAKSAVPLADRASMNSSFGTIAARRRLPPFRHSSVSEPPANQPSTSGSEELEISTTTGWR